MAHGSKTGGRQKGTPNKTTAVLKEAILKAAENAGKEEGLEGYLTAQAVLNPTAFLTLLGKVLPMQAAIDHSGEITVRATKEQRDAAVSAALRATDT